MINMQDQRLTKLCGFLQSKEEEDTVTELYAKILA